MAMTPTLSACVDSITDKYEIPPFYTFLHLWTPYSNIFLNLFFGFYGTFCEEKIMCNMSHVKGHISHD